MASDTREKINSRTALLCHEYIHKTFAPSRFDLTGRLDSDPLPTALKIAGQIHEQSVIDSLEEQGIRIARIPDFLADSRKIEETLKAMASSDVDAIHGSLFISDTRVSKPDLLVAIESSESGERQWRPVDIKSHSAVQKNESNTLFVTELPNLEPENGAKVIGALVEKDAYQLAHYIRHLQELNLCDGTPWAGIIGKDSSKIVWADLNALTYGKDVSASGIFEKYENDSAAGIEILEKALAREANPDLPEVTIPRRISGDFGCPACEFRKICRTQMEAFDSGNGHVTLLSDVTADYAIANLDGVEGIRELSTKHFDKPAGKKAVIRAQVWLSGIPARLDVSRPFKVPEFDIEIDIDLENSQDAVREAGFEDSIGRDAVYLYGYGIHDRTRNPDWKSARFGYFDDYADNDEAEFSVLSRMWNFLQEQVKQAETAGKSIGIFHYSSHEKTWWRNFANRHASKPGTPTMQSVEEFVDKYFVDLFLVAKEIALPVTGYSIKTLAPKADFKWRVDDAGGGNSIVYYQKASSPTSIESEQKEAVAWLRSYNEDDVRATFAVRSYLRNLVGIVNTEWKEV
jgi:predicted RecB family nuclease